MTEVLRPPQLQGDLVCDFPRELGLFDAMGQPFGSVIEADLKFEAYLLQAVNDYGACIDALRQLVIPYEGCAADPLMAQAYRLIADFDKLASA